MLPPGPSPLTALSNLRAMRQDIIGFLIDLQRRYGDVVRFRVGPIPIIFCAHPDGVRHVLQENARHYNKQTRGFAVIRELLGEGLLTSEGDTWFRQRRLMQPAFHRQRLQSFGQLMVDAAEAVVTEWEPLATSGETFDVTDSMMKLTLRVASQALFGTDLGPEAGNVDSAFTSVLEWAKDRLTQTLFIPRWLPTASNRRGQAAVATLDRVVYSVIEQRRRSQTSRDDLLQLLMDAKDEDTGEKMNDRQLRDEVMTLMLAGHETSANALSWTFALLSKHVAVRKRLEEEVDAVLGGRLPSLEDLPKLRYTRQVLDEGMRMYPPAWSVSRCAMAPDKLLGYDVPEGQLVFLSSYVTHRHPDFWPNPESFDPDRFAPEHEKERHRMSYFPFGGGPRLCIGNNFALMEMTIALAALVQKFRVDLAPGQELIRDASITLRPRGGLRMRVTRRNRPVEVAA
ncbi:MAG: cytochrome P450 [Myxococcaceae bacterium]